MSLFATDRIPIPTRRPVPETLEGALPRPQIRFTRRPQKQDAWCYAACAQMAIEYCIPEKSVKQCEIAGFVKEINCCSNPIKQKCITSGCGKGQIKPIFTHWGVSSQRLFTPATLQRIGQEINATPRGRLLEAVIDWRDAPGSSHAVLITGIIGEWIFTVDPLSDPKYYDWHRYDSVVRGFENGNWDMTWISLEREV